MAGSVQAVEYTRALVRATIVRPLSLTSASEMNFGIVLTNGFGGTLSLSPSGDFTALGVTMSDTSNVTPGKFKIFGTHNQAYSIVFARTASIETGADPISVVTFIHDAGGTPTLDDNGKGLFNIGATLRIGESPSAGSYYGSVDVIISNY